MLTIEARAKAQLTTRGSWFARTAVDDLIMRGAYPRNTE
jgi:hypothetical protein